MMNILKWFFRIISGESGINWLSIQFSRYTTKRLEDRNQKYKESVSGEHFFEVPGAGEIIISESCHSRCGTSIGFSIGCSWGRYGFVGGVIGRDEAKRLADHIIQKISECTETETDEKIRIETEWQPRQTPPTESPIVIQGEP